MDKEHKDSRVAVDEKAIKRTIRPLFDRFNKNGLMMVKDQADELSDDIAKAIAARFKPSLVEIDEGELHKTLEEIGTPLQFKNAGEILSYYDRVVEIVSQRFGTKPPVDIDEYKIQLEAWQEAFGTTQLTHALGRLQAAENTKPPIDIEAVMERFREEFGHAEKLYPKLYKEHIRFIKSVLERGGE